MHDTLDRAVNLALISEGGFSDHPKDPGGPTNMGVTLRTYSAWCNRACTVDDLKAMDRTVAVAIFTAQYATSIRYDDLPCGVDYVVFDCSINSGPGRAARILQQVLGLTGRDVDGIIGSHTLALVRAADPIELVSRYDAARLAFMKTLKAWNTFGNGWSNRVAQVGFQALALATSHDPGPGQLSIQGQAKATGPTKVLASLNGKAAVTSVAGAAIFAGGLATQLSSILQPYGGVRAVAYVLLACSVVSSAVPLWTAIQRAASGAASA